MLEEPAVCRYGVIEAVDTTVLASLAFVGDQGFDMRRILDLSSAIKASNVPSDDVVAIEHAHGLQGGRDHQCAAYVDRSSKVVAEPFSGVTDRPVVFDRAHTKPSCATRIRWDNVLCVSIESDILKSRLLRWGVVTAAILLVVGSARGAGLTKTEQRCANTLNKNGAKVARAVDSEARRCFKDGGRGKLSMTVDACLAADRNGKINKRKARTRAGDEAKCATQAPAFAYTDAGAANAIAESEALGLVGDLFGAPVDAAVADCSVTPSLCSCQQAVLKAAVRISETRLRVLQKCKQAALRENKLPFAPGAASATELAQCVDDGALTGSIAADSKGKIAKRVAGLASVIGSHCQMPLDGAFPGACDGLSGEPLTSCIDARSKCRVCQTVNAVDSLTVDCDLFDDGVADTTCVPAVPIGVDATLEVDWSSSRPYNRGVYGFNANMARGIYAPLDPPVVAEVGTLTPELIRFPGGMVANVYHWNGQPGSFDLAEMTSTNNATLNARYQAIYNDLQFRRGGVLSFDDFVQLCQTTGVTSPIVVANLYRGSAAESAGWVQHAQDIGFQPVGWELGNEGYIESFYNDQQLAPTDYAGAYVATATAHAQAMRAVNPNLRLGVPVTVNSVATPPTAYHQAWNQALASESFYDAVIPHYYVGPDDPAVSFDDMAHWLFEYTSPGSFLDQTMDATVAQFGASTPIWATEWNYMGFQNQVVNLTQLQALYITSAWMRLAARPQVELAGYQLLVSAGAWPSLVYRDEAVDPPASLRLIAFYAFELIGEASLGMDQVMDAAVTGSNTAGTLSYQGNPVSYDYPNLVALALSDSGGSRVGLLIANREGQARTIGLQDDASLAIAARGVSLACLSTDQLESNEHNAATEAQNDSALHITRVSRAGAAITVPPWSECVAVLGP